MKMSDTKGSAIVELGPQFDGDSAFAARMRLHQSWYRACVLRVPYGTGPGPGSTSGYGNMLRPEDGEKGLNFLSPQIFEVVQRRMSEGRGAVEPFRLLHNLLSSQPMCFNLFGPLAEDVELATLLRRRLLPDEVTSVTKVIIEYAPEPADEYLGDATAFDAFVEYSTVDGKNGFCGIETKLTEPFSQREYDRPEYWKWMKHQDAPWRPGAHSELSNRTYNQLWRLHLLAFAMLKHTGSPYQMGHVMLVRHAGDERCAITVSSYRALLREGDETFQDITLQELLRLWRRGELADEAEQWLADFELRYVNLRAGSRWR